MDAQVDDSALRDSPREEQQNDENNNTQGESPAEAKQEEERVSWRRLHWFLALLALDGLLSTLFLLPLFPRHGTPTVLPQPLSKPQVLYVLLDLQNSKFLRPVRENFNHQTHRGFWLLYLGM